MLDIKLVELNISEMSDQQWHDLLDARTEFMRESRPNEPVPSHQTQRQALSKLPELRDHVNFWLIHDNDANCLGYCVIQHPKVDSPDYAANKDRIYVEPTVLKQYRRQGVGTQLLPLIVDNARKARASWVQWDTKFESGFRFSEKIGATEAGRQRTNRLEIDQVDWDMMQEWVRDGQTRNPAVELIHFINLPAPTLIKQFCDLITEINRLQPDDNVEGISYTLTPDELQKEAERYEERKIERVVLCTRENANMLSGMTDMFYTETKSAHARISLTGVRRECQGRGLGKWLKAAMMLNLRETYPDIKVIDTDNFNSNRPMLAINERMGFKLFEQYMFYKIRVDDLAAKI